MSDNSMPKPTAKALIDRLERHYIPSGVPLPGGVFIPEVTHGTAGGRRCDALYVGFTSSRGRHLIGHEIKVSRSDWLAELDAPHKAEAWASQCHAWYVVAPSEQIVRREEVPHGWGLMVPNTRAKVRFDILVKAVRHEDQEPSWMTVLSILKRLDTLRAERDAQARKEAEAAAQKRLEELVQRQVAAYRSHQPDVDELRSELRQIQEALGMRVRTDADGSAVFRDDQITLDELRAGLARYLRADRDAQRAAAHLTDRYHHPVDSAAGLLSELADRIRDIQRIAAEADESPAVVS